MGYVDMCVVVVPECYPQSREPAPQPDPTAAAVPSIQHSTITR